MSASTDSAASTHAASAADGLEFFHDDLTDPETAGNEAEDYQRLATRRAQLEDADTLRRMRAL